MSSSDGTTVTLIQRSTTIGKDIQKKKYTDGFQSWKRFGKSLLAFLKVELRRLINSSGKSDVKGVQKLFEHSLKRLR